eukprot:scaffold268452_cov36-Tisochrysis_lutea.AAC.3
MDCCPAEAGEHGAPLCTPVAWPTAFSAAGVRADDRGWTGFMRRPSWMTGAQGVSPKCEDSVWIGDDAISTECKRLFATGACPVWPEFSSAAACAISAQVEGYATEGGSIMAADSLGNVAEGACLDDGEGARCWPAIAESAAIRCCGVVPHVNEPGGTPVGIST